MGYEYKHGANIYIYDSEINDYSSNTNPISIPIGDLILDVKSEKLCRYPDPFYSELRKKISMKENTSMENIFVSNGAADIIFRLVLALMPQKALLLAPTFSEYEKALRVIDCSIDYHYLRLSDKFELRDDYLSKLDSEYDIVFLCNPNNPTSKTIDINLMKKIVKKFKKIKSILVVDECFIEFISNYNDKSFKKYIDDIDNLVIIKAFTKIYNMAGYRLGYCIAKNENLLNRLYEVGADWAVSSLAQEIGLKVLDDSNYLFRTHQLLNVEREYLVEQLINLGIDVIGYEANYIFFCINNKNLKEELLSKNFLIRSCANYNGLDCTYYRICIKDRMNNELLIKALNDIIKER